MKKEDILEKLNKIAKQDSSWMVDFEKRQKQWWWKKHWNRIFLKYLRVKRKLWKRN